MIDLKKLIQVNLPFDRIHTYGPMFLENGLQPELGISGKVLDTVAAKEFETWARAFGGREITVHGPFMDLAPGGLDPEVVRVTRERLCRAARVASLLGAKAMVCHAGYEYRRFPYNLDRWVEEAGQTWERVLAVGEESGLIVLVENVYEREPEPIRRVLERVDNPRLRFCLDTGHFNTWSHVELSAWLEALGPWLARLHLHDNDGSFDQHLPIGQGSFDFKGLFRWLGDKGISPGVTLEPHTPIDFVQTFHALRKLNQETGFFNRD